MAVNEEYAEFGSEARPSSTHGHVESIESDDPTYKLR
jgi:hypothetical protein